MNHLAALTKITCAAAATLLLASACGGNSFSGTDDPQGGAGSGGTASTAGKPGTAGRNTGGTHSAGTGNGGTSSGGGVTAGAGGTGPGDACSGPPASGDCLAYLERWYHDPSTGLCRSFVYGGCGGNANNYASFEECQKACPGGSPNYDACAAPTDCVVTGAGCCGVCDSPDLEARDLIAYNKKYAGLIQQCALDAAAPEPNPEIPACAPCPPLSARGSLQNFVADCVQGQCAVVDVRTSPLSACQVNEDCRLRNGNGCCEGCGSEPLIAVKDDGSFEKLVCGDLPVGCPECAPGYPASAVARCDSGHCQVAFSVTTD